MGELSWTPDAQTIAILGQTHPPQPHIAELFVTRDQGRSVERLTNFQQDYDLSSIFGFAISPDGHYVFFDVGLVQPHARSPSQYGGYGVVTTDSKTLKLFGQDVTDGGFAWAPDSHAVAVASVEGQDNVGDFDIRIFDPSKGEIRQLTIDGGGKHVFDWR